ncbi:hypothetical protein GOODEAATRI_034464 [Goodea atripinnis]|uniref:Uncharacterized protein n=1 Tax=Goodea atripinnis TaxID=208336 RepID=A0ABV0PA59_9TELE
MFIMYKMKQLHKSEHNNECLFVSESSFTHNNILLSGSRSHIIKVFSSSSFISVNRTVVKHSCLRSVDQQRRKDQITEGRIILLQLHKTEAPELQQEPLCSISRVSIANAN